MKRGPAQTNEMLCEHFEFTRVNCCMLTNISRDKFFTLGKLNCMVGNENMSFARLNIKFALKSYPTIWRSIIFQMM